MVSYVLFFSSAISLWLVYVRTRTRVTCPAYRLRCVSCTFVACDAMCCLYLGSAAVITHRERER